MSGAAAAVVLFGIAGAIDSSRAADLPSRIAPPVYVPPPQAFSWTGFYVGVNAGYALDHVPYNYEVENHINPFSYRGFDSHGINERGELAGGQIGYNSRLLDLPFVGGTIERLSHIDGAPFFADFARHIVVGTEADADWSDINGSANVSTPIGPATFGTRIKNFGTLRSRVGYGFDHLLIYVFDGISFATTENYYSFDKYSGSESVTRFPHRLSAYGIGAEYALSNNWSVKLEYMYDYIIAYNQVFEPAPAIKAQYLSRTTFDQVRVGLNYKFDMSAPAVVARY